MKNTTYIHKYIPLNQKIIKEFDGKPYIPENQKNDLINQNVKPRIPVYFAKSIKTEILHDTPVRGAYEYGLQQITLNGPFSSETEAESNIISIKEKTDSISFEFSSKIIARLSNSQTWPPEYEKFFIEKKSLMIKRQSYGYEFGLGGFYGFRNNEEMGEEISDLIPEITKRISDKIVESTELHRIANNNNLLAVIGDSLIQLSSSSLNFHYEREMALEVMSKDENEINNIFSDIMISEFFHENHYSENIYKALAVYPGKVCFIEAPGPKFSMDYDSIDNFLERQNFIY
ncbi:MAG: hypothetical protein KKE98_06635 [Nanoarchaeota archaeon]|nr:hypothetical protein [Nanoarchaeota archaeon]MBU1598091.1 hypothetical protein [Nanoarchaeota archaeon]MBU2441780.1 hypothetical protein [Nanoarchaeota archaeon]